MLWAQAQRPHGPMAASRDRVGLDGRSPGCRPLVQLAAYTAHRLQSVCEGEGENTHASEFKFQFPLWDLDVNLLGLKSRRECNLLKRVWKLLSSLINKLCFFISGL